MKPHGVGPAAVALYHTSRWLTQARARSSSVDRDRRAENHTLSISVTAETYSQDKKKSSGVTAAAIMGGPGSRRNTIRTSTALAVAAFQLVVHDLGLLVVEARVEYKPPMCVHKKLLHWGDYDDVVQCWHDHPKNISSVPEVLKIPHDGSCYQ